MKRFVAAGTISATGVCVLVPTAGRLTVVNESTLGLALAALGAAIALVLVAAGGGLYRSDVSSDNVVRVAAWNTLGLVVLGGVLLLARAYLSTTVPLFLVADVLAVSAFAHVLIGVNDVRRIRAAEVAEKNEKLAVLGRVLRHNLRGEAQLIGGYTELLATQVDDTEAAEYARNLQSSVTKLGTMNDNVEEVFRLIEDDDVDPAPVAVESLVEDAVAAARSQHPEADVTYDVVPGTSVLGGRHLGVALGHLVDNAVEHNDQSTPTVHLSGGGTADGAGWVDLTVSDNGPGIPEDERAVVTGESTISQLTHGRGLGLWIAQWAASVYGGSLVFGEGDGGGQATLRLRTA